MAGIVTDLTIFMFGLFFGAGLTCLGLFLAERRQRRTSPPPLTLVPQSNTGFDGVTAAVPPHPTYQPVYLSDAQIQAKLRGQGADASSPRAHDPIEASRR